MNLKLIILHIFSTDVFCDILGKMFINTDNEGQ